MKRWSSFANPDKYGDAGGICRPVATLTMSGRQARPYLPGNIRINGVSYPDVVASADNFTLAFSHRDRLLQADRLIDCTENSIGPEPGTEYVMKLIAQSTGTEVWSLANTDASIPIPYVTGGDDAAVHTLTFAEQTRWSDVALFVPDGTASRSLPGIPDHRPPVLTIVDGERLGHDNTGKIPPPVLCQSCTPLLMPPESLPGIPDLVASGLSIPADDTDYPAGTWPASPFSFGTHQVLAISHWTETTGPLTVLALEGDASALLLDSATGATAAIEWDAGIYLTEMDITIFTTDGPV